MKTSNTFWKIAIGISDDTISALDFSVHSKKLVADALAALQRVFLFSPHQAFGRLGRTGNRLRFLKHIPRIFTD
uniref:hypothetical protein n=1 Tax=Alloprevotella sp. TaxID=1872471 RepID=UPI004026FE0C